MEKINIKKRVPAQVRTYRVTQQTIQRNSLKKFLGNSHESVYAIQNSVFFI